VRGFEDPDILELDRYCPTVTTQNLNVVLQIASSMKMPGSCGVKSTFMQSGPLTRSQGVILVKQPGGLPGLAPGELIQVLHGVYGLVDAPLHWRRALKPFLCDNLGYRQSRLHPRPSTRCTSAATWKESSRWR